MFIVVKPYFQDYRDNRIGEYIHVFDSEDCTIECVRVADFDAICEIRGIKSYVFDGAFKDDEGCYDLNFMPYVDNKIVFGYSVHDHATKQRYYIYNDATFAEIVGKYENASLSVEGMSAVIGFDNQLWNFNGVIFEITNKICGVSLDIDISSISVDYAFKFSDYIVIRCVINLPRCDQITIVLDKLSQLVSAWYKNGTLIYGDKSILSKVETLSQV